MDFLKFHPRFSDNRDSGANLKKILALVLAFACAFTMFAGAAFTDSADIKVDTEVVDTLVSLGVVNGYDDGSFKPNGTVTRAEMAKMIYVLRTGNSDASAYNDDKTSFTDIGSHWARGYIKYCQSLGIIAGKSNTKFCPNDKVTAQEAAKMLLVTLGYNAEKAGLVGANWASKTNALADEAGLLEDVNTSFTSACPRQYAAQLIYNTIFANTVILRDGEYTNMNALGTGKNATVGVKYMDLVEFDAGTLYTCKLVDGKDYYSITTKNTPQGGHGKVYTDASDLLGQNVTVLMKSTSKETTVYGIYADEDSKVLATGYVGALEQDGDKKVKLNGTSYKVEQTVGGTEDNEAKIVTYAQSNSKVQLSNADASLVDLAAEVDKTAQSIDANIAASTIKLIDNDGNGKVDAAVYTPAEVGKVNTVSKSAIAVTNGVGTVKFDDYDIYDGVKKNDYVSVIKDTYTSDDNGIVTKLDVVSGKIDGARTNEVKINGTWYKVASTAPTMATGDSYDVAIVGGVVVFGEMTAESSKNVMAITGVKSKDGTYTLENEVGENDKYLKVKAYFADSTSSEIKISKINGTKLNNLTVDKNSTLEATVAKTIAVANLYTYSKLSDGMYDVKLLSDTNKAGYDVVGNGNYNKQKIDSKTLADDAVVFVIATNETKVMTGKQIKDWPNTADFAGMYAATESNGINYIKVAAIKSTTSSTPNADGDLKYAYVVANSYTSKVEGEDGNKTAYDVWTADGAKTLYVDGTGTTVASGSILVYKEDGKYITITDSFKPANNSYAKTNDDAKISIDTVAITGFDYKSEGTLAIAKDASSTIPTDLTLDKDCVFIAVNSKDEEGMEGGMDGVQFANPGKVNSSKYIPNAIVVTDSDDDNNVLAVIYDANDIDWNDGLKDASNNPAEF